MISCLYTGTVRHRRTRPATHDFRYRVFMFYLDLDELHEVERSIPFFSVNRFNAVSFYDRDHVDRRAGATKQKVLSFLSRAGIDLAGGRVVLLTSCRLFGYVFNPISLYYCHDRSGALAAIVAEVSNTFGGWHLYLLDTPVDPGEGRGARRYRARKVLHVSPFISMDAEYEFHLPPAGDTLAVSIVAHEAGLHVLDAWLHASRRPLTWSTLARVLLAYPFLTLKTIGAIHGEALRLYLKRAPVHRLPAPSAEHVAQQRALADPGESRESR